MVIQKKLTKHDFRELVLQATVEICNRFGGSMQFLNKIYGTPEARKKYCRDLLEYFPLKPDMEYSLKLCEVPSTPAANRGSTEKIQFHLAQMSFDADASCHEPTGIHACCELKSRSMIYKISF